MGWQISYGNTRNPSILTVCIPSYERPKYLEYTLKKLERITLSMDVIISDDSAMANPPKMNANERYIHQSPRLGAFPNMQWCLAQAKTKYAVYCADDDYLVEHDLRTAITYLEAHPEVSAYCAPCEIWDEVNQKTYWNAFKVKQPRTYTFDEGMDLFNFIIDSHIWPEHMIYRTPVPIKSRTRAYWAFADLVDILKAGAIYFSDTPFYRNLLVHPVGLREQLGNVQCLSFFDEYRGGLEVLAHGLFGAELPYKARFQIQQMIQSFICSRMHTAARLYINQGNEAEAMMLLQRLSIADPRPDVESTPRSLASI